MQYLSWEKRGDQSGAALPYPLTEVSLKAAPAASILATEAQAPSPRMASLREPKRKPAAPAISLIQTDLKRSLEYADVSAKRIPKNSKPGSQNKETASQKGNRQNLPNPLSTAIQNNPENMQTFLQKEFKNN
jgi:hypothetical protein